ncbi:hypothetical protein PG994_006560 [Apiospora phragmitis]|uniref:HD domain-containing protein n=1 Tax=Apiospora phragmitis TaxID=2905665 RepID=A0ABR1VFD4_9PEZI
MAISKLIFLLPTLLSGGFVATASQVPFASLHSSSSTGQDNSSSYPNRTIAGVTVIDTPVVRAAQAYAREHASDFVYNHVMRGWLFGTLIWQHSLQQQEGSSGNNSTNATVPVDGVSGDFDIEVQAVAALLHDLGWDQTPSSPFISPDRRFEVDGAIASREFLQHYHGNASGDDHVADAAGAAAAATRPWGHRRTQLVWDSIALHATETIFQYKEPEVQVVGHGIWMDFEGPTHGVTEAEYAAVVAEYPRAGFREGVNQTFVWLCGSKPQTTYGKTLFYRHTQGAIIVTNTAATLDTFMQPFGDNFVANYSAKGHRAFDIIMGTTD